MGKKDDRISENDAYKPVISPEPYEGPEKQFVRREGLKETQRFIDYRKSLNYSNPIKYFTFPGKNASDIGLLYAEGIISKEEFSNQVAICDEGNALFLQNEFHRNIGDFLVATTKRLENALSDSNDDLVKCFPFDVINLDFCDTLTRFESEVDNFPNLDSIWKILEYQRNIDFLLFITTRELIDPHNRIKGVIIDNFKYISFKDIYTQKFHSEDINACLQDSLFFTQLFTLKIISRQQKAPLK